MATIAGLSPTGRKLVGPASDLVELEGRDGLRHTAIVFHAQWREHPALNEAISVVEGFLGSPMVVGLVDLVARDPGLGAFVYGTGQSWAVGEVVRMLSDAGETAGTRAGLELLFAAGQVLAEAADSGESAGVYSHGSVNPYRLMLKRDGQVQVVGYALPQVEMLAASAGGATPSEESFRYAPPERLQGTAEDLTTDLFSLSLVAFELMTGRPIYDGLAHEIQQQAARAEGSRRLYRFRDSLPASVRDLLSTALRPEQNGRFPDGRAFLDAVGRALSGPGATGLSLLETMERITRKAPRVGQDLQGGRTVALKPGDFAKLAGADDNAPSGERPARRQPKRTREAVPLIDPTGEPGPVELPPPLSAPVRTSSGPPRAAEASPVGAESQDLPGRVGPVRREPRRGPRSRGADPDPSTDVAAPAANAEDLLKSLRNSLDQRTSGDRAVSEAEPRASARQSESAQGVIAEILGNGSALARSPKRTSLPTFDGHSDDRTDRVNPVLNEELDVGAEELEPPSERPVPIRKHPSVLYEGDHTHARERADRPRPPRLRPDVSDGPWSTLLLEAAGGVAIRARAPAGASVAEAVAALTGRTIPLRVDLMGHLLGWWRLRRGSQRLAPRAVWSEQGADGPLELEFVANDTVIVDLEVRHAEHPFRSATSLGTAVPVGALLDHLETWLKLPPENWVLSVDGEDLDVFDILADRPLGPKPKVLVRSVEPAQTRARRRV